MKPSSFTSLIVNRSYSAYFIYYHIWAFSIADTPKKYERALAAAYLNPDLWSREEFWLNKFVQYSRTQKCPLIVIVWPLVGNPKVDYPIHLEKVAHFFTERGIPVVDTSSMEGAAGADLAVSRFDLHPNEKAHSIAARLLYDAVRQSEMQAFRKP